MNAKKLLKLMGFGAIVIFLITYFITGSIKWALAIGGICFAIDLTFAPWIKKKLDEIDRGR